MLNFVMYICRNGRCWKQWLVLHQRCDCQPNSSWSHISCHDTYWITDTESVLQHTMLQKGAEIWKFQINKPILCYITINTIWCSRLGICNFWKVNMWHHLNMSDIISEISPKAYNARWLMKIIWGRKIFPTGL